MESSAPETGGFLSRDAIFTCEDLTTEIVDVPSWGGKVKVRALTGDEVDAYQKSRLVLKGDSQEVNTRQARAQLVLMGAVDANGNRLFNTKGDLEKLGRKSNKGLEKVADVIARLSGLKKEDIEVAGESSAEAPGGDLSSD